MAAVPMRLANGRSKLATPIACLWVVMRARVWEAERRG
jgi:hypothetical protein